MGTRQSVTAGNPSGGGGGGLGNPNRPGSGAARRAGGGNSLQHQRPILAASTGLRVKHAHQTAPGRLIGGGKHHRE